MPINLKEVTVTAGVSREQLSLETIDRRLKELERCVSVKGDSVTIQAQSVEIKSSGIILIESSREVWINGQVGVCVESGPSNINVNSAGVALAGALVKTTATAVSFDAGAFAVSSGTSRFSGVLRSDTVITTTVVATTYTPGAGNLF